MFPDFSDNLRETSEIVYQDVPHFQNYKDKTLMLVGGGPSSASNWNSVDYDYLWSMNHYYKNSIFRDKVVDLAMMMAEPNTDDHDFKSIRDEHETHIGYEVHDRWENSNFEKYQKHFCMHTRFYGRIGIGARMKIFAAHLGFKKVYFTGCDGPAAIFKGDHFFEPGKKTIPSVFNGLPLSEVSHYWKLQYDYLWEYIHEHYPQVEFENLGGGEIYHEKC